MSKTLVTAKHTAGPLRNGDDGCHARWANEGMCPGVQHAEWLNGLGDDAQPFGHSKTVTNGQVRDNWLKHNNHVVAVELERSQLSAEQRRLHAALRHVNKRLKAL